MLIQVNTDRNIEGDNALAQEVESVVRETFAHFSGHITRVEVHLSDENSATKAGTNAIRCLLEARLAGRQPVAVSQEAPTVAQAVDGAAEKMKHMLLSTLGRLGDQ